MSKLIQSLRSKKDQILCSAIITVPALLSTVSAHAEDTGASDTSAITGAITTGISDTKSEFLAILGVAVAGAMAFFAIKYAVNQGIGFFSKISKKG